MNIPGFLVQSFGYLDRQPILFPLLQEVLGTNLPKTLTTRSKDEMLDVGADQFGGTITFFGGGYALNWLLDEYYKLVKPGIHAIEKAAPHLRPALEKALPWRVIGKSIAILSMQGAFYWAVPFLRNYLTAKRTGSNNFTEIIGATQKSEGPKYGPLKEKLDEYKNKGLKILGIGAAIALAGVLGSTVAIKRGALLKNKGLTPWLMKNMALGGGHVANYPKWAQFWFIAVASYVGRFHAFRDKFELKEQLLNFGSFLFGWFGPPQFFKQYYVKQAQKALGDKSLIQKVLGPPKEESLRYQRIMEHLADKPALQKKLTQFFAKQQVFGLIVSIVFLSILPNVINWVLTSMRLKQAREEALTKTLGDMTQLKTYDTPAMHFAPARATQMAAQNPVQTLQLPSFNRPLQNPWQNLGQASGYPAVSLTNNPFVSSQTVPQSYHAGYNKPVVVSSVGASFQFPQVTQPSQLSQPFLGVPTRARYQTHP